MYCVTLPTAKVFFIFASIQKATNTLNFLTNRIYKTYIFYFSYPIVIFFFGKKNTYLLTYIRERKQKYKINSSCNSFAEIFLGIPQRLILGPLLFDAYIRDLFHDTADLDFEAFYDDNTPHSCLTE